MSLVKAIKRWMAKKSRPHSPLRKWSTSLSMERLDSRVLLNASMPVTPSSQPPAGIYLGANNELHIHGTSGNDKVEVVVKTINVIGSGDKNTAPMKVQHVVATLGTYKTVNGKSEFVVTHTKEIEPSKVSKINFSGYGGDDAFYNSTAKIAVAFGGAGNDTLVGGDSNDILDGGAGDDHLDGGFGADKLYGQAGNDKLFGGFLSDELYGGAGNDELHGGHDNDKLDGGAGNDLMFGDDGNDTFTGGAGNDTAYGGAGNDRMLGDDGDDHLVGEAGIDSIWGGAGSDLIQGGDGNDKLYGDAGNDTVAGGAGHDEIRAGAGDDLVYGDAGNDLLYGDAGNDDLNGGAGSDEIRGGAGNDAIDGFTGSDLLYGDAGDDVISGHDGNDTVRAGAGNDTVYGNNGNDLLHGESGDDRLYGGDGADTVSGGAGNDRLEGGSWKDLLKGEAGNDLLFGDDHDDVMEGGAGKDELHGGLGMDQLHGGSGDDRLFGDEGSDQLHGDSGDDELHGGADADRLFGNSGNDQLWGDAGFDWLEAGSASEFADGGGNFYAGSSGVEGADFNAHLWAPNGAVAGDVQQRGSPTCVFLSSVAGTVASGVNLAARIQYLGNYHYQVQLFREGAGWIWQDVSFNGWFNTLYGGPDFAGTYEWYDPSPVMMGSTADFWTILFQRAYHNELVAIDELDNFRDYELALSLLTGMDVDDGNFDPQFIADKLSQGHVVVAGRADDTELIVSSHAYTILKVWKEFGTWMIEIRNPWGFDGGSSSYGDPNDGLIKMTWDDFENYHDFDRLYYTA